MDCDVQYAIDWAVTMGFTPVAEGKTLVSAMKRPSTSQVSPVGSTTEFDGDTPIRHVPIWCADPKGELELRRDEDRTYAKKSSNCVELELE